MQNIDNVDSPLFEIGGKRFYLFGPDAIDSWAIANLLLAVSGFGIAGWAITKALVNKKKRDNDFDSRFNSLNNSTDIADAISNNESRKLYKKYIHMMIMGICAIIGVVMFVLTQNINGAIAFFDWFTIPHVMFTGSIIIVYLSERSKQRVKKSPYVA